MTPFKNADVGETVGRLMAAAARVTVMDPSRIASIVSADSPDFANSECLPPAVLREWPSLSAEARAVALLCAADLSAANESRWDRLDRE